MPRLCVTSYGTRLGGPLHLSRAWLAEPQVTSSAARRLRLCARRQSANARSVRGASKSSSVQRPPEFVCVANPRPRAAAAARPCSALASAQDVVEFAQARGTSELVEAPTQPVGVEHGLPWPTAGGTGRSACMPAVAPWQRRVRPRSSQARGRAGRDAPIGSSCTLTCRQRTDAQTARDTMSATRSPTRRARARRAVARRAWTRHDLGRCTLGSTPFGSTLRRGEGES